MEVATDIKQPKRRKIRRWLLIGFGIFLFLFLALCIFVGIFIAPTARQRAAQAQIQMISAALENYKADFQAYPPDDISGKNGSKILTKFLCRKFTFGEMQYGPYLENVPNGELVSALGGHYTYKILDGGKSVLVIDPGNDKNPGGIVDSKMGFVLDGSDACKDNLYSR